MPEIGEVARIVHYIHKHLVGKTLAVVKAQHDENVFGKAGTSAAEFEKALTGKRILDARQQGKYFWLVMSSPPHPLFHFGMAGWFNIRNIETAYYKPTKPAAPSEWPPKYWKFALATDESPPIEAAFVDFRRFSRIRLVDCPADEMRQTTPLKENGPDPVIDREVVTEEWLVEKMRRKKIPVKALMLDQANISGIGNWVGDEILYNAKIHPEQYSNTLSDAQLNQLHKSIHYVCGLAVETRADSSLFPEEWLFKHRWGKGKKDSTNKLSNGEKIVFLQVGGRTSAVVPSVQKKTGPVAGDIKGADGDVEGSESNPKKRGKKAAAAKEAVDKDDQSEPESTSAGPTPKKPSRPSRKRKSTTKDEDEKVPSDTDDMEPKKGTIPTRSNPKKRKPTTKPQTNGDDEPDVLEEVGHNKPESAPPTSKKRRVSSKSEPQTKDMNGDTTDGAHPAAQLKENKSGKSTGLAPKKGIASTRKASKAETVGQRRSARTSGKGT